MLYEPWYRPVFCLAPSSLYPVHEQKNNTYLTWNMEGLWSTGSQGRHVEVLIIIRDIRLIQSSRITQCSFVQQVIVPTDMIAMISILMSSINISIVYLLSLLIYFDYLDVNALHCMGHWGLCWTIEIQFTRFCH